jgi:N-glycosylase/DNA lyase
VESCIRLFGMHDLESFPIDVWVKRLMNRFYGFEEKDKAGMDRFAREHFGKYAGLAQQYLFYYIRCLESDRK